MEHSLRQRQLSVTRQDKTLISRNQISAENTRVEGQGNQQKTAETLLWAVQQRRFLSSVFFYVLVPTVFWGGVFHTVVVSVHSSFYAWEGQPPFQDNASSLAAWRTEHDLVNLPRQHIHTYTHKLTFLLFIFIVGLYVILFISPEYGLLYVIFRVSTAPLLQGAQWAQHMKGEVDRNTFMAAHIDWVSFRYRVYSMERLLYYCQTFPSLWFL